MEQSFARLCVVCLVSFVSTSIIGYFVVLNKSERSHLISFIKIKANASERQQIISIANVYRANIVDVSPDSIMVEITGNNNKVEAFRSLLEGFEIQELVRTGITGLIRGRAEVEE